MARKIEEQIGSLEDRLKRLKAKQQQMQARQRSAESRKSRRDDTRRKILVGAIVLAKIDQGVMEKELLLHWLDGALTREDDRALFELAAPSGPTSDPPTPGNAPTAHAG